MSFSERVESRFRALVASLCALYLALQAAYILRLPLVMDEYQGAATVIDLTVRFPYRDFAPYKTVLGHYLQLPPMLLGDPPWQSLMFVKFEMALLNTASLAGAAFLLRRHFPALPVLLGLTMTVFMSNFLERSSEIRVDMLTAWAGLFSLLALLSRRWATAGILAGISFLVSQKGIYFSVAGGAAALAASFGSHGGVRRSLGPAVRFAAGAATPVLIYLVLWTILTSWHAVYDATFVRPQRIAFQPLYEELRQVYWPQSVSRNPAFYAFALFGLIYLALDRRHSQNPARDRLLLTYGAVMLGLAAWHKQPWPYFFVMIVPTLFVLCVAYFDRATLSHVRGPRFLDLPRAAGLAYVFLGLGIPLTRVPINLARNNGFQKGMVTLSYCVLQPDDGYLAGVDLVYARTQPVGTLRWIDRPRIEALRIADAATLRALTDSVVATPVKLVIENYRTRELPPALRDVIEREYVPFWGSIRIYGRSIEAGTHAVNLRFSGSYLVESTDGGAIVLDGAIIRTGGRVSLERGEHTIQSDQGARIRLSAAECEASADPRQQSARELFPGVYAY